MKTLTIKIVLPDGTEKTSTARIGKKNASMIVDAWKMQLLNGLIDGKITDYLITCK